MEQEIIIVEHVCNCIRCQYIRDKRIIEPTLTFKEMFDILDKKEV